MQKLISYWSVKGGLDNTRPVAEAMDEAKAAGFDGIELAIAPEGVLNTSSDRKTCEVIRETARKKDCVLETLAAGFAWGVPPTHLDESVRKKSIELHQAALQRAAWIGAKAMLFVPGAVKIPWDASYGPVPYEQAAKWAREAIKRLAETAEKVGVDLCVENVWNGLFYSPIEFAGLIDEFKSSPRVGIYFDVGNVLGLHQHPPHWINFLGKRIKRIHIKDFKTSIGNLSGFCDLTEGDVPWKEVMTALRNIGYDKTIVAEMMPPDETLLKRTKTAMDKIFAM
ncbi:MAG: sugar phosphate isomerase/epimerase family protein [Tepidisphaeraceae bacterium]